MVFRGNRGQTGRTGCNNTSLEARNSQAAHEKMTSSGDFPGGPVVKNPPSSAGNADSVSGQGTKIPQATTREAPTLQHRSCMPQPRPDATKKK